MESMTGYGAAERDGFKVEVKSLNHRYLDVSVKMPGFLMEQEIAIRKLVKETFERGKVDVAVTLTDKGRKRVTIDASVAKGLYEAFSDLQRELSLPGALSIDFFSGFREVLVAEEPELNTSALHEALGEALARTRVMRRSEGAALVAEMRSRLVLLGELRDAVAASARDAVTSYRDKLLRRLGELLPDLARDESRVAQEIAFMATKGDVTEELARLESHFIQFASILDSGTPSGRKLDFLLQEMHREVNTIASKVDDTAIISRTLDMKTEVEKLREQAQNIQ